MKQNNVAATFLLTTLCFGATKIRDLSTRQIRRPHFSFANLRALLRDHPVLVFLAV
jgi:hypothetical protein